jgi:predicted RNA-binding Zn-ribbon protein involved in translation (DUF1610 family)
MTRAYRRITKEELQEAVIGCLNFAEVCRLLNRSPVGGNITNFQVLCRKWEIDTSHMTGQAHARGKTSNKLMPPEIMLVMGEPGSRRAVPRRLKRALLAMGVEYKCNRCGIVDWHGKQILEIDHIDGQYWNNTAENLQFLCPNCHAAKDK